MWGLILQVGYMAEGLRPKIMIIVLCPTQGLVDHHCARIVDIGIDTVLCNRIMMVASNSDVIDALTLWDNFIQKILGGVYDIFSTVPLNGDAYICNFSLKLEFGLDSFSSSKSHLMNDSDLDAGCVTE